MEQWLTDTCEAKEDLRNEYNDGLFHNGIKEMSRIRGKRYCETLTNKDCRALTTLEQINKKWKTYSRKQNTKIITVIQTTKMIYPFHHRKYNT